MPLFKKYNQNQRYWKSILVRRFQRYFNLILKRLTIRRLLNLFLLLLEIKTRKTRLLSRPVIARINTYPFCNLRCPGCLGKIGRQNLYDTSHIMAYDEYRRVIDKIAENLLMVILYDEGEPLLHRDIYKIIQYTSDLNISTSISSNFSMRLSDEHVAGLTLSGLDRLIVALDGMTQEIYERYRVGGRLNRVIANLKRVIRAREQYGRPNPMIEIQFLDFGYNAHQIEDARRFSESIGADHFSTIKASIHGDTGRGWGSGALRVNRGCFHLWLMLDIASDGNLFPCDFGEDNGMKPLGSILDKDLDDLWNHRRMKALRSVFNQKDPRRLEKICHECSTLSSVGSDVRLFSKVAEIPAAGRRYRH